MYAALLRATCLFAFGAVSTARADVLYVTTVSLTPELQTVDPNTAAVLTSVTISNQQLLEGGLCDDGVNLFSIDGFNDSFTDNTFRIDPATGAGTIVGDTTLSWYFRSVEVHRPTGVLYATSYNKLFTLDTVTGAATLVANLTSPWLGYVTALAIAPDGTAYLTSHGGAGLFRLNLTNGAVNLIGYAAVGSYFRDLSFDSSGTLWGIKEGGGLYTINTTTAAATLKSSSADWLGIAWRWDPNTATYCTAKTNSQGCTPSIFSSGIPSATESFGFTLFGSNELNNKVGLVLYSEFGRDASPFGPGGTLCVKAPTRRSKGVNAGGNPAPTDCSGVFTIDFNTFGRGLLGTPPNPAAYLSIPGQVVTAQFWGRDNGIAAPNNFSLSNGLEFTLQP